MGYKNGSRGLGEAKWPQAGSQHPATSRQTARRHERDPIGAQPHHAANLARVLHHALPGSGSWCRCLSAGAADLNLSRPSRLGGRQLRSAITVT